MTDPHVTESHVHTMEQFEDEVELMDYLKVLWKWKYLILAGTLICAIGAGIISLQMTKVYSVDTVLQPGILKITDDGKTIYIDSAKNIKALIDTNAVDGKLLKNINAPNKEDVPKKVEFKVTIPKGTNAVEVSYETAHVDMGLQILKNLNELLVERYGRIVRAYSEDYGMKIYSKSSEIKKLNIAVSNLEAEIETTKREIDNLKQKKVDVEGEISRISKNTDLLISERNKFLSSSKADENVLSALIYSNTIQQNISYLAEVKGKLNSINSAIFKARLSLEKLHNAIKDKGILNSDISEQIKSLEFKKNIIQNIQIIKQPESSDSPIKPKMRLNILLAAVVGLFLTVFLAFFVEYISKYKAIEQD